MFIVVADHKIVLVTDVDDVAWQSAQDQMEEGECEYAYEEEIDENELMQKGTYTTIEGDVITLDDYQNAEHFLR